MHSSKSTQAPIDFTQVDWISVFNQIPGFPVESLPTKDGSAHHRDCPMCGKKKFRYTNKHQMGNWVCVCGSGTGLTLIKEAMRISDQEAFKLIRGEQGRPIETPIVRKVIDSDWTPEKIAANRAKLRKVFVQSKVVSKGDVAARYLCRRVPYLDINRITSHHRFHPGMKAYEEVENQVLCRGVFPVFLALVQNDKEMVTMHRHFLTKQGKKAAIEAAKQQMKGVHELNGEWMSIVENPSRTLGVGEGFETMTAVAVAHQYGITVRAYLNEGNLRKAQISRDDFDRVIIYADNDPYHERRKCHIGLQAAQVLALRLREQGFEVEIKLPVIEGQDWCDVWYFACQRVSNLPAKLITKMYQEKSDDPFEIIAELK